MGNPIQVLVVDDSATVRQAFLNILTNDRRFGTIEVAQDPLWAMEKMKRFEPDVIVLDVEMPRMDGLTFLKKIMSENPRPVIICSSLAEAGSDVAFQAMAAGAVEIIEKPKMGVQTFIKESSDRIIHSILSAAMSNVSVIKKMFHSSMEATPLLHPDKEELLPPVSASLIQNTTDKIIAIGASTGGTVAVESIFRRMPVNIPGIVLVQHMPEKFTYAFAARLNDLCDIEVKEAQDKDRVIEGRALVAPGNKHLTLTRSGAHYIVEVKDGPVINHHRPSVDVLFRSVARAAASNAVGVILTGMGADGAAGMEEMHNTGAHTIAQDRESCVVYGMPGEAVKRGGVDEILPLKDIPDALVKCFR